MNTEPDQPETSTETLAPPQRPRSRFWEVTTQVLVSWVLYMLSIGPVYWQWYAGKYVNGPTILSAFYEPLWRLCGIIPPLRWFMNWYVSLWIL